MVSQCSLWGFKGSTTHLLQLVKLVLALDVVRSGNDHSSHQATEGRDAISLADTNDGGIDVGSTCLQGAVGIGNSTASIVMEMSLDV